MYKLLLFFVNLLFFTIANANTADSLIKLLSVAPNPKDEIQLQHSIAIELINLDKDKAFDYAKDALKNSEKLNNNELVAKSYVTLGELYYQIQNDKEALLNYQKAKEVEFKTSKKTLLPYIYNNIALEFYFLNGFDSSSYYYNLSLKESKRTEDLKEKANANFGLGNIARLSNKYKDATKNYNIALDLYKASEDLKGMAKTSNSLGLVYFSQDIYDSAVYYYDRTQEIYMQSGDIRGSAIASNNIGNVYIRWGKYDKAIASFQKALKKFESIDYKAGIASCFINMGVIYENLMKENLINENKDNLNKALEFYNKALVINEQLNNQVELASIYNNMGNVSVKLQEMIFTEKYGTEWLDTILKKRIRSFKEAIVYYEKSLNISEKLGRNQGIASTQNNLGRIYLNNGDFTKARKMFEAALETSRTNNNNNEICLNLFQIGLTYEKTGDREQAKAYFFQVLDIASKFNLNELKKSSYERISNTYESSGDYKESLRFYKKFIGIRDTIFNEENFKTIQNLRTQYDTEKKEQQLKLASEKSKLNEQVIRQQKFLIYIFIFVILLIIGFSFLVFMQNKKIKRTNQLLGEQNVLITKQKEEITDSIHYARRIQRALLPQDEIIKGSTSDYFILYRPRDIVSGDFYWFNENGNRLIIAAADCTGHGVPGAFMSMLGVAFLNEIVSKHDHIHANEILNELRSQVIKSLHQTGKIGESQDGMDLALYIIDKEQKVIEYAGANNPLILIRNNEVVQYKADKMPIGIYVKSNIPFENNVFEYQEGDCFYTFSDGYQDQFGGPESKKFMIKRLKELFLSIHKEPMDTQKNILESTITEWMGNSHQIDDIIVLGVRV